ncbi:MAG TPA: VWA domain-containing protein, partial [Pyrinomonadaceae bacterium]|nr:VWA domain-containing protein [Pyrinomonadaceae bacterium]
MGKSLARKPLALLLLVALLLLTTLAPAAPSPTASTQQPPPAQENRPSTQSPAQDAQTVAGDDDDVVRITSNLVQLDVVVKDDKGNLVTDLTPEDFELYEDGKRQPITNFSFVSTESGAARPAARVRADRTAPPVPPARLRPEQVRRTIALVVNDLGTSFESMYHVRRALKKFVEEEVQPGDLVAVVRASAGMGALQQFTSDKRVLLAAIEQVRWSPLGNSAGVSAFAPVGADPSVQADRQMGIRGGPSGSRRDAAGDRAQTPTQRVQEYREEIFTVGTLGALNYILRG